MSSIIENIRAVYQQEANAILDASTSIDSSFETAVNWVLQCKGRVICCGLGKSGHIAKKAAATFSSTGTTSFFLHAAEALHGDLGMVTPHDLVIFYTYSGESDEIGRVLPAVKSIGAQTAVICGRPDSTAGRGVDLFLNVAVESEACPNNLAPTTSTTLMLVLSDALAVAAMKARKFTDIDFARYHPAGTLGRRLTLKVRDLMRMGDDLPISAPTDSVLQVMEMITKTGAGCTCVLDKGNLVGLITEGDLRRWIVTSKGLEGHASDLMTTNPSTLTPDLLAFEALEAFENHPKPIGEMPVLDADKLVGLIMLKDLSRSGII